jgi:uncharacterized protein (TIRG00374 family)
MKLFKIIFLLLGLLLLGWVIDSTNLIETWDLVRQIGYGFILVLAIYLIAFVFDSLAWQLTILSAPLTSRWLYYLFEIKLAGEAFNNILPAASIGGEPIKALLLKNLHNINYNESIASLILVRTINTIALILFLTVGFILILESDILEIKYYSIAGTGLATLISLIFLFFTIQRFKLTSVISKALSRQRGFGWLSNFLHHINSVDEKLVIFYTAQHGRAAISFALAFCNWVLGVGEIMITMHFLGHPVTLTDAWIIEAIAQLVRAATFFIPASIGAQEGAFLVIGSAVTGSPTLGLSMAIIRRAREIIWISWGVIAFYKHKPNIANE